MKVKLIFNFEEKDLGILITFTELTKFPKFFKIYFPKYHFLVLLKHLTYK